MISIKKFLIIAVMILLTASISAAQEEGSVLTALSLVDDFDALSRSELTALSSDARVADYLKSAAKDKEKAIADIKALRWSETPSAKRFNRLYKMYDSYTKDVLENLTKLSRDFSGAGLKTLDEAGAKLSALRNKSLEELKQSSKHPQGQGTDSRIVPVIDRSPYDDTPGSQKGFWER